jgi:N-acetylmuramoyl-L-alanine amidase
LFISLHVNANELAKVEGLETYILNFTTHRSAMAAAARENATADKTISELQDILQVLARNTKIAESGALAQTIHKAVITALSKDYKVRDLGVKEAPFFVLVGTECPSILMEIGFITNEKEADRLKTEAYLDRLADGLADGLASYVKSFSS